MTAQHDKGDGGGLGAVPGGPQKGAVAGRRPAILASLPSITKGECR